MKPDHGVAITDPAILLVGLAAAGFLLRRPTNAF